MNRFSSAPAALRTSGEPWSSSRLNRVRADAHRDGFTGKATADVVINEGA